MTSAITRSSVFLVLALGWAFIGYETDARSSPDLSQNRREVPAKAAMIRGADPASTSAVASANDYYATTCATCHGTDGKGDGPTAAMLNPKPKDFSDPKWQASVTDAFLAKVIVEGGAAVGKSPTMPPHPALRKKPDLVHGLVHLIRGFAHR